jgi:hypothetical protein
MGVSEELVAQAKAFVVETAVARVGGVDAMGDAQMRSSLDALLDRAGGELCTRVYAVCSIFAAALAQLGESLAVGIRESDEGPLSETQKTASMQWAEHWIRDVVEQLDARAMFDPG